MSSLAHDLIETGDKDSFSSIEDRNGSVVLAYCRRCKKGEVELGEFCEAKIVGGLYNWKGQRERLIYLGRNWSGNGFWHQFALVDKPDAVWCEVVDADLHMIEATVAENEA